MNNQEIYFLSKQAARFKNLRFTTDFTDVLNDSMAKGKLSKEQVFNYLDEVEDLKNRSLGANVYDWVWINPKSINRFKKPKVPKQFHTSPRNTIAHEAFHTVPILGKSESLARFVGGFREVKKNKPYTSYWDNYYTPKATYFDKMKNGYFDFNYYVNSFDNPDFAAMYPKSILGKNLNRLQNKIFGKPKNWDD